MKKDLYKKSDVINSDNDELLYEENGLLRHRRISILKVIGIVLGFLIAISLLYFAARAFFRVSNFVVDGNNIYTTQQILDNFEVKEGDFLFSFASSEVEKKLIRDLPYIIDIEIKRIYPSTLSLNISEYKAEYICEQKDRYILFTSDLKVLEVARENKWGEDVIFVEMPDIAQAIAGDRITFFGDIKTEYISGFIKYLKDFKNKTKIDRIYLRDYFNIKMMCESRYIISFGKYDAIDVKISTLARVMQSKTVSDSAAASIDISDPKEPRVIPYDGVDAIS